MKEIKLPIEVLDSFDETNEYSIDQQLEFFESTIRVNSNVFKNKKYVSIKSKVVSMLAKSFSSVSDSNVVNIFQSIDISNTDLFWCAFDKFNLKSRISEDVFEKLLNTEGFILWQAIKFKKIVKNYDKTISVFMINHPIDTALLLIDEYLLEKKASETHYYFPESLTKEQKNGFIDAFVESNPSNFDYLRIIFEAQSSSDLPLKSKTQLKAKHLYNECLEEFFNGKNVSRGRFGVEIAFDDIDEDYSVSIENNVEKIVYNQKWLKENLDYPTILNNFIHVFGFTDYQYICQFVSKEHLTGVFELFGLKGKKEYRISHSSSIGMMRTKIQMHMYYRLLKSLEVDFEDVIKWFFEDYLNEEFGVSGFTYNPPVNESNYLTKCKSIVTEMDGVLKQYKIFCEEGEVNRELLEFRSEHIKFNDIPSLLNKKYAYANDVFSSYSYLLFSSSSGISYTEKFKDKYGFLLDLITSENVVIEDFYSWDQPKIKEMIDNNMLFTNELGYIKPVTARVAILSKLYINRVICLNYYNGFDDVFNQLFMNGSLVREETLFARTEQQYMNYILNRAEYSNGLDLRNKYGHGSSSIDDNQNYNDYIELLIIMVLIIIKINEEMILREKDLNRETISAE